MCHPPCSSPLSGYRPSTGGTTRRYRVHSPSYSSSATPTAGSTQTSATTIPPCICKWDEIWEEEEGEKWVRRKNCMHGCKAHTDLTRVCTGVWQWVMCGSAWPSPMITHTHTYTHTPLQILTTTRPWQQCFCIATTIWSPTTTPHFWGRRWHKIKRTGSLPHSLDLNHENRLTASLSWLQMKRQANYLTFWFVHDRAIARPEQIQHTVRWLKRVSTLLTSHHGMLHTQTEITKVTQPQQQVVYLWACDVIIQSALGLHHLNPSHTCTTTQRQVACHCIHVTLSQSLWN